jgi:hypothetical protein
MSELRELLLNILADSPQEADAGDDCGTWKFSVDHERLDELSKLAGFAGLEAALSELDRGAD